MLRARLSIHVVAMLVVLAPALGLAQSTGSHLQPASLAAAETQGVHQSAPNFTLVPGRPHSARAGWRFAQYCNGVTCNGLCYAFGTACCVTGAVCGNGAVCCGNGCCPAGTLCQADFNGVEGCVNP
jgi:hypothetical protein